MNPDQPFIGIVRSARFNVLSPENSAGPTRLTTIQMQESRPPESAELALADYEGQAIAVQGHDGGGWIYSAQIVDTAGPIVAALVEATFSD